MKNFKKLLPVLLLLLLTISGTSQTIAPRGEVSLASSYLLKDSPTYTATVEDGYGDNYEVTAHLKSDKFFINKDDHGVFVINQKYKGKKNNVSIAYSKVELEFILLEGIGLEPSDESGSPVEELKVYTPVDESVDKIIEVTSYWTKVPEKAETTYIIVNKDKTVQMFVDPKQ